MVGENDELMVVLVGPINLMVPSTPSGDCFDDFVP